MAAADIGELGGEGVDGDALHGAGLPLEGVHGEERPAADHGPAGDVGVGLHDLLDFGGGVLRRLLVVIDVANGDAGILGGFLLHAANPGL